MKKWIMPLLTICIVAVLVGCGGSKPEVAQATQAAQAAVKVACVFGTGWFVHLLLIVVPLLVILVKLFRESEATSDSLISLEGQLRRLNNKIDDLEAGMKGEKKGE